MKRPATDADQGPRFYTVAEASRLLRIREPRIREAVHQGELRAARIGRLFRIAEADLLAYFDSKTSGPPPTSQATPE